MKVSAFLSEVARPRLAIGLLPVLLAFPAPACRAGDVAHWLIDPAHTHIAFAINALGYPRTHGEFRQFTGSIDIDFDKPSRSKVSFAAMSGSADVGSDAFNDVVKGDGFLDADHFKEIDFTSTSVEKMSADMVRVTGDLTMCGVTHPLIVDVQVGQKDAQSNRRLSFTAQASIDRLAFGMNAGYPVISRDVDIVIASEAFEK